MNKFFNSKLKSIVLNALLITGVFAIASCHYYKTPEENAEMISRDPIDRQANLQRHEFAEIMRPQKTLSQLNTENGLFQVTESEDSQIPPLADVVLAPDAPDIDSAKRVTLTVNETVELRDVLLELARLAELELALDPAINGGIILTVKNRPVGEVMEMVAELADLKYSVADGVLRVTRDNPYLVNYQVDYLNMARKSTGSMDISTTSGGGSGGGGSSSSSSSSSSGGESGGSDFTSASSFTGGSSTSISSSSDADLWASVEGNIKSIISSSLPSSASRSGAASATTTSATSSSGPQDGSTVSVNKQAGVISVFTTQRKHKAIKDYLDIIMNSTSSQVLIEAKVLEVELNDSYATGIDWNLARGRFSVANNQSLNLDSLKNEFLTNTVFTGLVGLPNSGRTFASSKFLLNFIEGFGTARALSNPRITIQNNQQAILSFARNEAFFTIEVTPATTTSTGTSSTSSSTAISSSLNTVPIGVVLALQPSINIDTDEVTMHIRPTLTSKVGDVEDPAVSLNAIALAAGEDALADAVKSISSKIPVIQIRELDTVLKAKSGEVMVIGGLLQHSDRNADVGVPFISEIPILGNLTKKVEKTSNVVETVILLTAKIIPPRENYHQHDKKLFMNLTQDPRPFNF